MTIQVRTELEKDQHETLINRKKKEGITVDFQIREAIKMYVDKIKEKKGGAKCK